MIVLAYIKTTLNKKGFMNKSKSMITYVYSLYPFLLKYLNSGSQYTNRINILIIKNTLIEYLIDIFIHVYLILFSIIYNNLYKLICIGSTLWVLSYNYAILEVFLYIYVYLLILTIALLTLIHINYISFYFRKIHVIYTYIVSFVLVVLILFTLYNTLFHVLDLYYIIKGFIVHMKPWGIGPKNNPESSSSGNTGNNNPNKGPGSGTGFKNVDDDNKEDKKDVFDFFKTRRAFKEK